MPDARYSLLEAHAEDVNVGDDRLLPGEADAAGIARLDRDQLPAAVHRNVEGRARPAHRDARELPAIELHHELGDARQSDLVLGMELDARDAGRRIETQRIARLRFAAFGGLLAIARAKRAA